MVRTDENQITEDETTLYDRQLRCWGVEGQNRLRAANLLIVGMDCLITEICKNIVLAGVNSLTICDTGNFSASEIDTNYLGRGDDGRVTIDTFLNRLRKMNPNVKLSSVKRDYESFDEAFIKPFSVVVLTNVDFPDLNRINRLCRANGVKFYSADVWGGSGYYFVDLGDTYEYVIERQVAVKEPQAETGVKRTRDGAPTQTAHKPKVEYRTQFIKETQTYVPFDDGLMRVDLQKFQKLARKNQFNHAYFLVRTIMRFRENHHRNPRAETSVEDQAQLVIARNGVLNSLKLPLYTPVYPYDMIETVFGKFAPVCAIVGGSLAQEIIHGISGNQKPQNNFFFYNHLQFSGDVYKLVKQVLPED